MQSMGGTSDIEEMPSRPTGPRYERGDLMLSPQLVIKKDMKSICMNCHVHIQADGP